MGAETIDDLKKRGEMREPSDTRQNKRVSSNQECVRLQRGSVDRARASTHRIVDLIAKLKSWEKL